LLRAPSDAGKDAMASLPPAEAGTPVLITEQQVLFNTTAAAPLPRRRGVAQWSRAVAESVRAMFRSTFAQRRPVRRDYPSRLTYLEHSAMSREMDRL
jgi:hypothetical protein